MLLIYLALLVACCYILDALCTAVTGRRFNARVRTVRAEPRASLAAKGKRHV